MAREVKGTVVAVLPKLGQVRVQGTDDLLYCALRLLIEGLRLEDYRVGEKVRLMVEFSLMSGYKVLTIQREQENA